MFKSALGVIETVGLVAAIEAADTGVKAANVKLLGYELTKGHGLVTVKFAGDVGAVKAAVEAGSVAAAKVNKVWSTVVIPRPHDEIEKMIINSDTVGNFKETEKSENEDIEVEDNSEVEDTEVEDSSEVEDIEIEESSEVKKVEEVINKELTEEIEEETKEELIEGKVEEKIDDVRLNKSDKDVCNICGDPKCPRKKGEPRALCIHNKK